MATKYDDFGRPIYETAEEYNRAHRKNGSATIYQSAHGDTYQQSETVSSAPKKSAAQRHATREGSKKAMSKIVGVVISILALNIGAIFSLVGNIFDDISVGYEEEVWPDNGIIDSGEIWGDSETPLPEGYETFTYNGVVCTLPMSFKEILATGLTLEGYEESVLFPSGYEDFVLMDDGENMSIVELTVDNYSDEDILMSKTRVISFYVENPTIYDEEATLPHFTFLGGLTLESSYDEVIEVLGDASYNYYETYDTGELLDRYEWYYYDGNGTQSISVQFLDGVIESVSIGKTYYDTQGL